MFNFILGLFFPNSIRHCVMKEVEARIKEQQNIYSCKCEDIDNTFNEDLSALEWRAEREREVARADAVRSILG